MTEPQGLDNLKRIWQGQSTEDTKLTLEEVRERAQRFQLEKRVVGWIMLPLSLFMTSFFIRLMVQAWMEHRPGGAILIPIVVCLNLLYVSIMFIRSRKLASDAGVRSSLEAYRAHFEQERTLIPRVWGSFGAILLLGAIGALDLWMQARVFPIGAAVQFGIALALMGVIGYLGIRYKNRQIDHALHLVDGLERDIE
jgi:hypothetical protein